MSMLVNRLFLLLSLCLAFAGLETAKTPQEAKKLVSADINNGRFQPKKVFNSRQSRRVGDKDYYDKDVADKAAQDAKAASDAQNIAGKQASHQVKVQLAEKALRASKAAEAVLIGKTALVEQLAEEAKETQNVAREESFSLQRAQENVNAANRATKDARQQIDTLRRAVETAKSNLTNARTAAEGARRALGEKEQLLIAAKKRVEELKNRMQKAKVDLAKTNQAVVRAETSAREARVKVNHDTPAKT